MYKGFLVEAIFYQPNGHKSTNNQCQYLNEKKKPPPAILNVSAKHKPILTGLVGEGQERLGSESKMYYAFQFNWMKKDWPAGVTIV